MMADHTTSRQDGEQAADYKPPAGAKANTNDPEAPDAGKATGEEHGTPVVPAASPDPDGVAPPVIGEKLKVNDETLPLPPISSELRRAAEDVRILYSYISREGRLEPDKLLEKPLSTYAVMPDRVLDPRNPPSYEERATLWKILSELSIVARPASADAIRSSYYAELMDASSGSGRRTNRLVERPIRMMGIAGFIITLLLGLYVSFTESVVADTVARISEYNNMRVGSYPGTRLEKLVVAPAAVRSQASATNGGKEARDPSQNSAADDPTTGDGSVELSDFRDLRDEALDQVDKEIADSYHILKLTTFQSRKEVERIVSPDGEHSLFERTLLNRQGYINKTISAFILPAIASLLGAIVFILRDAQRRMESVSLSPLRSETYGPRLILAIIAGTVIGWLTGQDSSGVLGKISPAAASFVVGYCTEILFRLLDAVKQALGVDEEVATRQKIAPPNG